jgi:hypothetical protein
MAKAKEFTQGFGIETDDEGVRWLIGRVRIEEGVKTQSGLDRYFSCQNYNETDHEFHDSKTDRLVVSMTAYKGKEKKAKK